VVSLPRLLEGRVTDRDPDFHKKVKHMLKGGAVAPSRVPAICGVCWERPATKPEYNPMMYDSCAGEEDIEFAPELPKVEPVKPTLQLERASELLAEPDPGPTPWLIDQLAVDQALIAVVGRWKTTKSYALLDATISILTGEPFLGRVEVPEPGPVILIIEESGRKALWRRLDSLSRGRAIDRDRLHDLHFAANQRVRLDDLGWQKELLDAGRELRPRLIVLDPLARLKSPGRDESAQKEFAFVIEFIRELRDESGGAIAFVQHSGHTGEHMRGTSDLETVWESRLSFRRNSGTITIESEHREAEAGPALSYRLDWDEHTRTIRLEELADSLPAKVSNYLTEHPDASANEVHEALGGNRKEVLAEVKRQRDTGGSDDGNHPGTTPARTPSQVVPPTPLYEGSGTTLQSAGSESGNHPSPEELERLETIAEEMGLARQVDDDEEPGP
jgi:hypothetical protein